MTRRTSIVEQIGAYFASKGKALTADEYKAAEDVPIRFQLVKRGVGSWSRLLNMVGDIGQYDGSTTVAATPSSPAPSTEEPVVVVVETVVEPEPVPAKEQKPAVVDKTKGA
jgi:hypothetical protein